MTSGIFYSSVSFRRAPDSGHCAFLVSESKESLSGVCLRFSVYEQSVAIWRQYHEDGRELSVFVEQSHEELDEWRRENGTVDLETMDTLQLVVTASSGKNRQKSRIAC